MTTLWSEPGIAAATRERSADFHSGTENLAQVYSPPVNHPVAAGPSLDETLILVDADNTTIGYAPRRQCHDGDGLLHRAIAIILVNHAGDVLLQHRRSFLWDGFWDLTAATHTLHVDGREETYDEAARRCLRAEWGIEAPVEVTGAFTYFERHGDSSEHEYCVVLTGHYDGPVIPRPAWSHGYRWVSASECRRDAHDPASRYTPWAKIALGQLGDLSPSLLPQP